VYGDWGFDRKLSLGKGLNALFSGPPAPEKTMAAEVIAKELRLDLYKNRPVPNCQQIHRRDGKEPDQIFREALGSKRDSVF